LEHSADRSVCQRGQADLPAGRSACQRGQDDPPADDYRLTNGFSKKVENLCAAVSLHFAHYNFVRLHKTLRVTPAMAAGVSDRLWTLEELVGQTSK
jgi:hypothetical protein